MKPSKADLQLLQAATLDLHVPRELEGLRRVAPAVFKRVIPADYFVWLESGRDSLADLDGDAVMWDSPARWSPSLLRTGMSMIDQHPFTEHLLRTGDLGPMRLSDFWTREQQLASPLYQRLYRHIGVGRLLSIAIVRENRAGSVSLGRPLRARDFSERDREMLRWLAPHFVLALRAAEVVASERAAREGVFARHGLTLRESHVAAWLARGRTNPEIAEILAMKPRTVEKHVEKILDKLGAANRTAAARVILGVAAAGDRDEPGSDAGTPLDRSITKLRRVLRPARADSRR